MNSETGRPKIDVTYAGRRTMRDGQRIRIQEPESRIRDSSVPKTRTPKILNA